MEKPALGPGGSLLWDEITEAHELDPSQFVQLTEACRAKDRLDKLDQVLRGDVDTWVELELGQSGENLVVVVNSALDKANSTANLLKQLLASLRLPDATGKRPQQRGGARGAYDTSNSGKVSSLDRARARRGA